MATTTSGVHSEPTWERKEERLAAPYEEEEEDLGVPAGTARGEKYPGSGEEWWNGWNFGLTYNDAEYNDGLFWRAVLAEGAATSAWTFFLLATWLSLQGSLSDASILRVALTAGLTYAVLHWAFFSVSGGHMNPAVSLALMLNGRITIFRAICYWGAQIVGAIVGAFIARAMSPGAFRAVQGGVNRLNVSWGAAFLGEIFGTLLVVWAFLVAYDRHRRMTASHVNVMAPLFIGLAVTAAHLFLIPFTWCSINPARSFASAVAFRSWRSHWIWWVAPIIGAVAGPLIYESFFKYFKGTGGSTLTKQRDPYGPGQTRPGETRQQATTTYP